MNLSCVYVVCACASTPLITHFVFSWSYHHYFIFAIHFILKLMLNSTNNPVPRSTFYVIVVPWLWTPLVSLLLVLSNGPLCHVQSTLKWLLFASALFWGKKRRKRKRIACLTWLLNIFVLSLSGTLKNTCLVCSLHPFSLDSCKFFILDKSYFEFST